ncbi:hypothetical protein F5Y16DRAFT_46802 [Xylariaceae sp. FL0255]|nr:hypothetical protein F5Y16DRAFT_46802 [Xylariaceae sp. FL0255]
MLSKRKAAFGGLQRRVRARKEEPEPEVDDISSSESQDEIGSEGNSDGEEGIDESDLGSDIASDEEDEDESDDGQVDPAAALAQVSFGALAKAQASMPIVRQKKGRNPTKDESEGNDDDDEPPSHRPSAKPSSSSTAAPTKRPKPPTRTSKHAPMEITSKKPVSRRRDDIMTTHKPVARDPRFAFSSSTSTRPQDEARLRKAYAFLDEYRDSEMQQIKQAIRKTKSPSEKEELSRALKSMQSKREVQNRRDKEAALLAEHRKHEKELVAQGKKPFYLKKSEQKKQLLVDRFAGMKKKQVDKTIERRRKKLAARERRDMPFERRGAA